VGKNGKEFIMRKFRTMNIRAGTHQGTFEPGDRTRITNVGRFLRTNKLDELPQLWNVLKGEMSIVGPRPEVRKWVDAYPERWKSILAIRPGITDLASLAYRDEESILHTSLDPKKRYREVILPRKLAIYEEYIKSNSFVGDFIIFVKTIAGVLYRS
jgi:lipopolysaccharide/colanic/teichoic acid biosynthesis glycosyltransferase